MKGSKTLFVLCGQCYYETAGKTIRTFRRSQMTATTKSFFAAWKALAAAPHRLFFLGGACQGMAAMLWWSLELSVRL